MKAEGHLGRCYLKGRAGDAANVILSAVGYNLRLVLAWLKTILRVVLLALLQTFVIRLVACFSQIAGYRCLSLMRAFLVVNCQSALVWLALRSCSQVAISSMRICLLGMRRSRHWDVRTPSSDSARSSQLPCFGV